MNLGDIEYQYHLKIITYTIESLILRNKQINQDKSNFSEKCSSENSNLGNKNMTELNSNTLENTSSNIKPTNNRKKNIKLTMILQPNTIEGTKLLTITVIDYYEVFKDEQIQNITLSIFNNFEEILIKTVPLTKNCESIVIDANINMKRAIQHFVLNDLSRKLLADEVSRERPIVIDEFGDGLVFHN